MCEFSQNAVKSKWPWLLVVFSYFCGWVAAGILLFTVNNHHTSEQDALKWKRQAGKAYTELLVEKSRKLLPDGSTAKPESVMIPLGTLIECKTQISIEDRMPVQCENIFYPPDNY